MIEITVDILLLISPKWNWHFFGNMRFELIDCDQLCFIQAGISIIAGKCPFLETAKSPVSRSGESFFYGNWCVKLSENIRRRIWKSNVHTENSNKSQNASIFLHHSSIFNRGCLRPFKIYKYMFSSRYLVSYFF